jgi:hypothetical protein
MAVTFQAPGTKLEGGRCAQRLVGPALEHGTLGLESHGSGKTRRHPHQPALKSTPLSMAESYGRSQESAGWTELDSARSHLPWRAMAGCNGTEMYGLDGCGQDGIRQVHPDGLGSIITAR